MPNKPRYTHRKWFWLSVGVAVLLYGIVGLPDPEDITTDPKELVATPTELISNVEAFVSLSIDEAAAHPSRCFRGRCFHTPHRPPRTTSKPCYNRNGCGPRTTRPPATTARPRVTQPPTTRPPATTASRVCFRGRCGTRPPATTARPRVTQPPTTRPPATTASRVCFRGRCGTRPPATTARPRVTQPPTTKAKPRVTQPPVTTAQRRTVCRNRLGCPPPPLPTRPPTTNTAPPPTTTVSNPDDTDWDKTWAKEYYDTLISDSNVDAEDIPENHAESTSVAQLKKVLDALEDQQGFDPDLALAEIKKLPRGHDLTRDTMARILCAASPGCNQNTRVSFLEDKGITVGRDPSRVQGRTCQRMANNNCFDGGTIMTNSQMVTFLARTLDAVGGVGGDDPGYHPPVPVRPRSGSPPAGCASGYSVRSAHVSATDNGCRPTVCPFGRDSQGWCTRPTSTDKPVLYVQGGGDIDEDGETVGFRVVASHAYYRSVYVTVQTSDGTATSGDDYTSVSRTFIIPAGFTIAHVSVSITDDSVTEADETFNMGMSNPVNAKLDTTTQTQATIIDNDTPTCPTGQDYRFEYGECRPINPDATFDTTSVSAEEGKALTFKVNFDRPAGPAGALIEYTVTDGSATAGSDYTQHQQTNGVSVLSVTAGATSAAIEIATIDDSLPETPETLTVNLVESQTSATGTITDNDIGSLAKLTLACVVDDKYADSPVLQLGWSKPEGSVSFYAAEIFTGTFSGPAPNWAFVSTDRRVANAQSIASWRTSYNYPRVLNGRKYNGDWSGGGVRLPEWGATYTLRMRPRFSGQSATWNHATATCPPLVSVSPVEQTINEDTSDGQAVSAEVVVSLSELWSEPISVRIETANGSAIAGRDYKALFTTETIPAGAISLSVLVDTIPDDDDEDEQKTFTVSISNPSNGKLGAATATVTITDNDEQPEAEQQQQQKSGDDEDDDDDNDNEQQQQQQSGSDLLR